MSAEITKLHADLKAVGWSFGPAMGDTGVSWYAWKALDGIADCACNDKPPSFILMPYELVINGKAHASVEFEVSGEVPGGRWVNLKAYSVSLAEALQAVPECSRILSAAWSAAALSHAASTEPVSNFTATQAAQLTEQDAARYRWLLENYAFGDGYRNIDAALNDGEADKYLSPAIDAAILASQS